MLCGLELKKRSSDGSSEKSITDKKEKTHVYHIEEDKVNIDEESLPSSSPSDIEAEQSLKIQTMGDETKKELFDNENVTITQDSEDETHFTISVWDLGGQDEFCEAFSVGDTNCLQENYTGCDILGYFDVHKHKHK